MSLTNTSFVVLGMLNLGARSGYDIKRTVELSARHFWKISPVQIYPELQRLEEEGLIAGHDDPDSPRRRRNFELTENGREALRDWLTNGEETPVELRDAGLLKLFFADAVDRADALRQVRALKQRSDRAVAEFREQIMPIADESRDREGVIFPAKAAQLGLEFHEWLAGWYGRLEHELESGEN